LLLTELKNNINPKIIATIGPSSLNKEIIKKMDQSGVDIFRINLSHTELNKYEEVILKLREWTSKPVCPDTEGAQLRTGVINNKKNLLEVKANNILKIKGSINKVSKQQLQLNHPNPEKILKVGDLLKIDFNGVLIHIIKIDRQIILGKIISGGLIYSNKGISVDRDLEIPSFSTKDLEAIQITNRLKVPAIFLSFCANGESVDQLRSFFDYKINIISKIESRLGLRNVDEICKKSDGILIDRGDLSRDVNIERISFAQSYIFQKGKENSTPVYTATNFLDSMINNQRPNRAEINDIVSTLGNGGSGIVLAAETAIGNYPIQCVRIISNIIKEFSNAQFSVNGSFNDQSVEYLFSQPAYFTILPHGDNDLVNQEINQLSKDEMDDMPYLLINEDVISDVVQIAEGVYSPLTGFMNSLEVESVLNSNKLLSGIPWTIPIMFQLSKDEINHVPQEGKILLKSKFDAQPLGVLIVKSIEKLNFKRKIAIKWFGTDDNNHPGVKKLFNSGEYIISGEAFLFKEYREKTKRIHEYTPHNTREIFYHNGWHNVIGFHTRNIPHKGHEYIQKISLEISSSDAILISPVTGSKKSGDFSSEVIIACYEKLIESGIYNPNKVLLSTFNTYSRYSGPREAVFTAICRKNFGCNYFIVGRDHTGVGNYYDPNESQKIFDSLDLGIKVLFFNQASYCSKRKIITTEFNKSPYKNSQLELSGTIIRDLIRNGKEIPNYLLEPSLEKILKKLYKDKSESIFID